MAQTQQSVMAVLEAIELKGWSPELISDLVVDGGKITLVLKVDSALAKALEPVRASVEDHLGTLADVEKASVVMTAEAANTPKQPPQAAPAQNPKQAPQPSRGGPIPGVKHIIAVASGKGGVGKSTTSVNLALALQAQGKAVGILDADVYGPSMPRLMGISGRPVSEDNTRLKPMENYGVKVMSMGFLVEEDTAMIWRGPMVQSALSQMLYQVDWGPLDVLVVDMPPGTGDAQLTLAQQVPLAGAVIVSTPQDLALLDAKKGISMFRKVNVPLLGLIENMSTFICPNCEHESHIFGHGGAEREAKKLSMAFLGGIPLEMETRVASDAGEPIVATQPETAQAKRYGKIAEQLINQLEGGNKSWFKMPKISFS